jgi:hypothetical protein
MQLHHQIIRRGLKPLNLPARYTPLGWHFVYTLHAKIFCFQDTLRKPSWTNAEKNKPAILACKTVLPWLLT